MIKNIQQIIDGNTAAGQFYFSEDTMRWFNSKVYDDVFPVPDGALFITSEKQPGNPRLYTVRKYHAEDGDISTVGEFMGYLTQRTAASAARRAANEIDSE